MTPVETCLLGKEVISSYVCLENRVEGCGIVASPARIVICEGTGTSRMVICRRKSSHPRTEVFAVADGVNNSSSPSS